MKIRSHKDLEVYKMAFIAKLSDSEGESTESQIWLDFAISFRLTDRSPITDYRLPITDYRLPITDY